MSSLMAANLAKQLSTSGSHACYDLQPDNNAAVVVIAVVSFTQGCAGRGRRCGRAHHFLRVRPPQYTSTR